MNPQLTKMYKSSYNFYYVEANDLPFYNNNSFETNSYSMDEIKVNNPSQDISFDFENLFVNQNYISNENKKENSEEQLCYFQKNGEDNCNLLLGKKRNNNLAIEEKNELKGESKRKMCLIKKDTKESTNESLKLNKINVSPETYSKTKIYRNDYYIKKFKVDCFSNYSTKKLKSLLKDCRFSRNLGLSKIYMPNTKAFTSVANLKANKTFLTMTIQDIFTLEDGQGQNQLKNEVIFDKIYSYKKSAKNVKAYEDLVDYLNMSVEKVIKEYYNSYEFEKFKANKEIIEYDKAFYKEKKFSLLDDFGFLKLINGNY